MQRFSFLLLLMALCLSGADPSSMGHSEDNKARPQVQHNVEKARNPTPALHEAHVYKDVEAGKQRAKNRTRISESLWRRFMRNTRPQALLPIMCPHPDYDALMALYNATGGPDWTDNTGWIDGAAGTDCDPCEGWYGVECDGGRVTCIDLDGAPSCGLTVGTGNNLIGSIPQQIGDFPQLISLKLSGNSLSGNIPASVFNLSQIEEIDFSTNALSGSIPITLGNAANLTALNLDNNQLDQTIPSTIGNLSNLLNLSLSNNNFSGDIPDEIQNLNQLTFLSLRNNNISGSVLTDISFTSNLHTLWLSNNNFTGNIPSSIDDLTQLRRLDLSGNSFSGSIPTNIGNLPLLIDLSLRNNNLSGVIPATIGNLSNLVYLQLQDNNLEGGIPSEIENLSNLEILWLGWNANLNGELSVGLMNLDNLRIMRIHDTNVSGSIPPEVGNLTNLTDLDLSSNQLTGEIPATLSQLTSLEDLFLDDNQLSGCFPQSLQIFCSLPFSSSNSGGQNFTQNPSLSWQGDFTQFCSTNGTQSAQIGTPCNDNNPATENDMIQSDCSCAGELPACPTGTTITVTNDLDDGPGSLREAINCANADPDLDQILFDPSLSGSDLALDSALPDITDDGISLGNDGNGISIYGDFLNGNDNGLNILANNVSISNIILSGFPNHGLYMLHANDVVVVDCQIWNNGRTNTSGNGINITGLSGNIIIENNHIGTNTLNSDFGNSGYGLQLTGGGDNIALYTNNIAFNGSGGVSVAATSDNFLLFQNQFLCNESFGIDYSGNVNNNMPQPTLSLAATNRVEGFSGTFFTNVEIYRVNNSDCPGNNVCQGYEYLGTAQTVGGIPESDFFSFTPATDLSFGDEIVVITVDENSNRSSTFSTCATVSSTCPEAFPAGPATGCGEPLTYNLRTLDTDVIGGQSGLTVTWYEFTGLSNTVITDPMNFQPSNGNTSVTATTSDGSCTSGEIIVQLSPTTDEPTATNALLPNEACVGAEITVSVNISGGTPPYSGNFLISPTEVETFTNFAGGDYTFTFSLPEGDYTYFNASFPTVQDANGCFNSAVGSGTLSVTAPPTVLVPATAPICNNGVDNLVDLTQYDADLGGGAQVQWFEDQGAGQAVTNPTAYLFDNSGNVDLYVVVGRGGCPSAPAAVTFNVTDAPSFTANPPFDLSGTFCLGDELNTTFTFSGGTPPYSGEIFTSEGQLVTWIDIDNSVNLTITFNEEGSFNYTGSPVFLHDANGCSVINNTSNEENYAVVLPSPMACSSTPADEGQNNGTISFTGSGSPPYSYVVQPGNITGSSASRRITVTGLGQGDYTTTVSGASMECPSSCFVTVEELSSVGSIDIVAPEDLVLLVFDLNGDTIPVNADNNSRCYQVDAASGVVVPGSMDTVLRSVLSLGGTEPRIPTVTSDCAATVEVCVTDEIEFGNPIACNDVAVVRTYSASSGSCTEVSVVTVNYYQRPPVSAISFEAIPTLLEYGCGEVTAYYASGFPATRTEDSLFTVNGNLIYHFREMIDWGYRYGILDRVRSSVTCPDGYRFRRTYTLTESCPENGRQTFDQTIRVADCPEITIACVAERQVVMLRQPDGSFRAEVRPADLVANLVEDCNASLQYSIYLTEEVTGNQSFTPSSSDSVLTLDCADYPWPSIRVYAMGEDMEYDYCQTTVSMYFPNTTTCYGSTSSLITIDSDGDYYFCATDNNCPEDRTLNFIIDDVCGPVTGSVQASVDYNQTDPAAFTRDQFITYSRDSNRIYLPIDLPIGFHVVQLRYADGCGQTITELVPVLVEDCTVNDGGFCPIRQISYTLRPDDFGGGEVLVHAADLAQLPVACDDEIFLLYRPEEVNAPSFSPEISRTSLLLTCEDLGRTELLLVTFNTVDLDWHACSVYAIVREGQQDPCGEDLAESVLLFQSPQTEFCADDSDCTASISFNFLFLDNCPPDTDFYLRAVIDSNFVDQNGDEIVGLSEIQVDFTSDDAMQIELYPTGSNEFTLDLQVPLPIGWHVVAVDYADRCGERKVEYFTFRVQDCTNPSFACQGTVDVELVDDGNGVLTATISAADLLFGVGEDCSEPVSYAIYRNADITTPGFIPEIRDSVLELGCDDLGSSIVRYYGIDTVGNIGNCWGNLEVSTPAGTDCQTCRARDSLALVDLYNATNGPGWTHSDNWLTDAPLEDWFGVGLSPEGCVETLDLDGVDDNSDTTTPGGNGMTGPIPDAIGGLRNLRYLILTDNLALGTGGQDGAEGTLPDTFYTLSQLRDVFIENIDMNAPLSPALINMDNLAVFDATFNQFYLSDLIPAAAGFAAIEARGGGVTLEPQDSILTRRSLTVNAGEDLTVDLGYELIDNQNAYRWYRDEVLETEVTGGTGVLTLTNVGVDDAGTYFARISNPAIPGVELYARGIEVDVIPDCPPVSINLRAEVERNVFGQDLCVRIYADTFPDLERLSFSLNFPTDVLQFSSSVSINPPGSVFVSFSELGMGNLGVEWNAPDGAPHTASNVPIATLCFDELNQAEGTISFTNRPTGVSSLSASGCNIDVVLGEATVINSGPTCEDGLQNGNETGIDCGGPDCPACPTCNRMRDSLALVDLFGATEGANWSESTNWLSGAPLDEWHGIVTDGCSVKGIDLRENNLVGELPASLWTMTELESLRLNHNTLTGQLPTVIGNLDELRTCYLQNNDFFGPLPTQFAALQFLEWLDLGENLFSLSIPSEFGEMGRLRYLDMASNELTGPIPSELGELDSLRELHLSNNQFSASLPSELGSLAWLRVFAATNSELSGSIPSELGELTRLEILALANNEIGGSIPSELGELVSLQQLLLHANELEGNIPSELGELINLEYLLLADNNLTGTIPDELAQLTNLSRLYLNDNNLVGCLPTELDVFCGLGEGDPNNFTTGYSIQNNPQLPFQGSFSEICPNSPQTGAPCDDVNPNTLSDVIQPDCTCGCPEAIPAQLDTMLCPGESIMVNGTEYSLTNPTGTELLTTTTGCDSAIAVVVTQRPELEYNRLATICAGESYAFYGETYTMADVYTASPTCDSLIRLTLEVLPAPERSIERTICIDQEPDFSLSVGGETFNINRDSGRVTIPAPGNGCDSIINVNLDFQAAEMDVREVTTCFGEQVNIDETSLIADQPTLFDTISREGECSIYREIRLTFENDFDTLRPILCDDGTFSFGGVSYSLDNLEGMHISATDNDDQGCKLTTVIQVVEGEHYDSLIHRTLCVNDSIIVDGNRFDVMNPLGSVTISNTQTGCDTMVEIFLSFSPPPQEDVQLRGCAGTIIEYRGLLLSEENPIDTLMVEALPDSESCDSLIRVSADFLQRIDMPPVAVSACPGDIVTIGDTDYPGPGLYEDTLRSVLGCDSITSSVLIVALDAYSDTITTTICQGESFTVGDTTYQTTGNFVRTLEAISGCDSIITLNLTVVPTYTINIDTTLCYDDFLEIGANIYNKDNRMGREELLTVDNCDSIINVNLSFYDSLQTGNIPVRLCAGDTLRYSGEVIATTTGMYERIFVSELGGCDSLQLLWNVEVVEAAIVTEQDTICGGTSLAWRGQTLSTPGTYQFTETTVSGSCDTLFELELWVISPEDVILEDDSYELLRSEEFILLDLLNNDTVPYRDTLSFPVLPNKGRLELEDDDIFFIPNETSSGPDSFQYRICLDQCPEFCQEAWVRLNIEFNCKLEFTLNVPNGFTPNSGRKNEVFDPRASISGDCLDQLGLMRMAIRNIQSEIIFETDWGEYRAWDGTDKKRRRMPTGTYWYIFEAEGLEVPITGAVELVR